MSHELFKAAWVLGLSPLICLGGSFLASEVSSRVLICMHWRVKWPLWAAFSSLVVSPWTPATMSSLDSWPQLLSQRSFASFFSHPSVVTVLRCLMINVWKIVLSYVLSGIQLFQAGWYMQYCYSILVRRGTETSYFIINSLANMS